MYFLQQETHQIEHSIGTYYLAKLMLNCLKVNQKEKITEAIEKVVVIIATLCHDLGHGLFSFI